MINKIKRLFKRKKVKAKNMTAQQIYDELTTTSLNKMSTARYNSLTKTFRLRPYNERNSVVIK